MSRRQLVFVFLGALLVGGLGWTGFRFVFETYEEEVEGAPDPEVRRDRFLALEYLLEAMDVEVSRMRTLSAQGVVDGTDAVDVVFVHFENLPRDPELLERWFLAGVHVILVAPHTDTALHRQFLKDLGLRIEEEEEGFESDKFNYDAWYEGLQKRRRELREEYEQKGTTVVAYNTFRSVAISRAILVEEADYLAINDHEEQVTLAAVSGPWHSGRLTVIEPIMLLYNTELSEADHAQIIADVLSLQEKWPERAIIALDGHSSTWVSDVLVRGWPAFAALLLLFLLGLTRARRFGPAIPEPERRRRRRAEHVEATGRFLWHHHNSDVLLVATRRALIEAMARRRPSLKTLSVKQQCKMMAEELQVNEDEMFWLLSGVDGVRRPEDFRKIITRLEELRRRLR